MTDQADLTRRLNELERRVDLLFEHLQLDAPRPAAPSGVLSADVRGLLDRGDKLGAIALVRDQTGMGLSEARRTVEQIMGGS